MNGRRHIITLSALLLFLIQPLFLFAQTRTIENLQARIAATAPVKRAAMDSLRARLARALHEHARLLVNRHEQDSARMLFSRSLRICEMLHDSSGTDANCFRMGELLQRMGELDSAQALYQRSFDIRMALNRLEAAAYSLSAIGNVHATRADYTSAMKYYRRSLDLRRSINDHSGAAYMLSNIAVLLTTLGQHESALVHLHEALTTHETLDDPKGSADVLTNIGNIHYHHEQYDSAMAYYQRAIPLREQIGDRIGLSKAMNNIGACHLQLGDPRNALTYYQRVLDIREREKDIPSMISILLNLGLLHKELQEYEPATRHIRRALEIAEDIGAGREVRDAERILSEIAAAKGDFQSAYEHHRRLKLLNDSLFNEENLRQINELSAEFEHETQQQRIRSLEREKKIHTLELARQSDALLRRRLEQERAEQHMQIQALQLDSSRKALRIEQLDHRHAAEEADNLRQREALKAAQLDRQRFIVYALIAGVFLLLMIGILLQRRARAKRQHAALRAEAAELQARAADAESHRIAAQHAQKEKEAQRQFARGLIRAQEDERARIANDLHDSLGQELVVIKNRTLLALRDMEQPEKLRNQLEQVVTRADAVIQSMRGISHNLRPLEIDRVGFTETIRGILRDIAEVTSLRVRTVIDPMDNLFTREEEITLYRIIQEGLVNVVKHADASTVILTMKRHNGEVHIEIRDDGRGFQSSDCTDASGGNNGFGLHGIAERVQMLSGTFAISSTPSNGTTLRVTLHPGDGTPQKEDYVRSRIG